MADMPNQRKAFDDDRSRDPYGGRALDETRARAGGPVPDDRLGATPHRRRRIGWLPVLLLALLAVGAISLVTRNRNRTVASRVQDDAALANGVGRQAQPGTVTGTAAGDVSGMSGMNDGMIPVAQILAGRDQFGGQTVSGSARVLEVVSDRGFWIGDQAHRLFVVLGEKGAPADVAEHHTDVRAGQDVQMTAHVYTRADQVPGRLEGEARQIIGQQPVFLHAMPNDVRGASGTR